MRESGDDAAPGDDAAAEAEAGVAVVDYGKLPRSYPLYLVVRLDDVLVAFEPGEPCAGEDRCVTVFEGDLSLRGTFGPGIARDKLHLGQMERFAVLLLAVVSVAYIYYIVVDVLFHHIPRAAAESQPLALPDGVKPIAAVLAELAAGLYLHYGPGALAQVAADEVVVVDFAEKAYPLAVFAQGVGHVGGEGDLAHALLGEVADGKHHMAELLIGDARQKVGLVLDRIHGSGEVYLVAHAGGGGVVARGGHVELMAPALLEVAELDHAVAHDVGIGRKPLAHCAQGVFHHIVPILLMERHHIEGQIVAPGDVSAHLYVLLGRAVALVVVEAYADVEKVRVVALLQQAVHGHGAVNPSRYQCCYFHRTICVCV